MRQIGIPEPKDEAIVYAFALSVLRVQLTAFAFPVAFAQVFLCGFKVVKNEGAFSLIAPPPVITTIAFIGRINGELYGHVRLLLLLAYFTGLATHPFVVWVSFHSCSLRFRLSDVCIVTSIRQR